MDRCANMVVQKKIVGIIEREKGDNYRASAINECEPLNLRFGNSYDLNWGIRASNY